MSGEKGAKHFAQYSGHYAIDTRRKRAEAELATLNVLIETWKYPDVPIPAGILRQVEYLTRIIESGEVDKAD